MKRCMKGSIIDTQRILNAETEDHLYENIPHFFTSTVSYSDFVFQARIIFNY